MAPRGAEYVLSRYQNTASEVGAPPIFDTNQHFSLPNLEPLPWTFKEFEKNRHFENNFKILKAAFFKFSNGNMKSRNLEAKLPPAMNLETCEISKPAKSWNLPRDFEIWKHTNLKPANLKSGNIRIWNLETYDFKIWKPENSFAQNLTY